MPVSKSDAILTVLYVNHKLLTMRKLYLFIFLSFFLQDLGAQCVVSSNDNNWTLAEVTTCLNGCTMDCTIDIQASVSLAETIDLTSIPGLTFTISGTGKLTLNGGSDLLLSGTSTLVVTSTNANPLQSNQGVPDPVITIGGTAYDEDDFTSIVNGGGADANGVLPIELASFTGHAIDQKVTLEWTTITEINNDYIALEHSYDGRFFAEITRLDGAGSTNQVQHYSYEHNTPLNGTNYYRLKQVDYDGKFTYHEVISVDIVISESVELYPNPTQDVLNIRFSDVEDSGLQMQIFDALGRLVFEQYHPAGQSSAKLNISNLGSGVYSLRIDKGGDTTIYRFRKD